MHCSTTLGISPSLARLSRGLALLLVLSMVLQCGATTPALGRPVWPPLAVSTERWHRLAPPRSHTRPRFRGAFKSWRTRSALRLLAREGLLVVLLSSSGWLALTPWTASVLLLPLLQALSTGWFRRDPVSTPPTAGPWSTVLQRVYQVILILLLGSTAVRGLCAFRLGTASLSLPMALGTWVTQPDAETEIRITTSETQHYEVTLRGAFTFGWEPRDQFETWILILFLRGLHRVGEKRACLRERQITEVFGVLGPTISLKAKEVRTEGWQVLSDRYHHRVHSALPDAELSRAILRIWVPAFWLSAWDVRERLIQAQVLPNRAALPVEALHTLAHHTGFNLVRDQLLDRFAFDGGVIRAQTPWWTQQLFALNERLLSKLERGEGLTPQERMEIEPLRLNSPENPADSAPPRPLAACLQSALFAPPSEASRSAEPVRCTYCGSDQVAPKSKQSRRKTILDEFGEKHMVEVLRYYCHNPTCPYGSFTHFPEGVLPHSRYPVQMRLVAVEVYETLLSTYRRSARVFGVKAATLYHWVTSLSPAATCLAAYLGVVRTSGVIGIDDKWILVCSPSAVRPHGRRSRAVWRYAYFAIDVYSYDLLALELYPEHNEEAVRLILLDLKVKGIRPRVVVSDLDPAYGRMLPQIFPHAIHHECIFHALQNASSQMTRVYGRYYLEKLPETVPLHDAITHLFRAQTQKTVRHRFADVMALRATYVAKTPEIACVFDSLERHFPKLVNAIESPDIPRTNNATELVIRRFDQHYQAMCGLDTLESARAYLRVFALVYRLTPFAEDARREIRGQSPLELAGYDVKQLPIAEFFTQLKLPPLALPDAEGVPMP